MFEKPVVARDGSIHYGYSWCGGMCRWGTTDKLRTLNDYSKDCKVYVAIANDETRRLERENQKSNPNKIYPLVEWKMSEKSV